MNIDQLKKDIKQLTFENQNIPAYAQAYCKYYNIDFENRKKNYKYHIGCIKTHYCRITCQIFEPLINRNGTIFLIHGYYDHVGLFSKIIHFFNTKGYIVCTFDLPGHGLSDGDPASIDNFSSYTRILKNIMEYCHSYLPRPWHGYGQSTGSAILTDYLLDQSANGKEILLNKIILSAPLIRPYKWSSILLKLYILRVFCTKVNRIFTNNSCDEKFINFCHQDPLAPKVLPLEWLNALDKWIRKIKKNTYTLKNPTYIIQGTADKTIDAHYNIAFLQNVFINQKTLWISGAKHHLPNERADFFDEYTAWLSQYL